MILGTALVAIAPADRLSLRLQHLDTRGSTVLELVQAGGCLFQCQQSFWELMNPWYKSERSGHMPALEWHLERVEDASFVDACRAKVVGIQLESNIPRFTPDPNSCPARRTVTTITVALPSNSLCESVSSPARLPPLLPLLPPVLSVQQYARQGPRFYIILSSDVSLYSYPFLSPLC